MNFGGTLNPYIYAHDPVNMEDYSGQSIWSFFVSIARVVSAAINIYNSSPRVQTAVRTVVAAFTSAATSKPAAARPVTAPSYKAIPIPHQAPSKGIDMRTIPNTTTNGPSRYEPRGKGYVNVSSGLVLGGWGVNGGIKIGRDGVYPYLGVCTGSPGPSFGVSVSPFTPSSGPSLDISGVASAGLLKYKGGSGSVDGAEIGIGTPGYSVCTNYTR